MQEEHDETTLNENVYAGRAGSRRVVGAAGFCIRGNRAVWRGQPGCAKQQYQTHYQTSTAPAYGQDTNDNNDSNTNVDDRNSTRRIGFEDPFERYAVEQNGARWRS